jgi:hypothetical protein
MFFEMDPYQAPLDIRRMPSPEQYIKERRKMIQNHPDAGPLAVLWAKYPARSKMVALVLLAAIVGFIKFLVS